MHGHGYRFAQILVLCSSATRALNSALYCLRCVDIDPLLLSLSYGHSILS